MDLRPASEFTLEELTDAYNRTRLDYLIPMPMNSARLQEYIILYDIDLAHSYVAVKGEQIVGLGMLGIRPEMGWVTRLGVLAEGRRQGVGNAILQALLAEARRLRLPVVWLEVIRGNMPAHELFIKHHFRETRDLIVARRSPTAARTITGVATARKIHYLQHDEAIDLHCRRTEQMNWLNAVQSMRNVRRLAEASLDDYKRGLPQEMPNLSGIWLEFSDGSQGWVTYLATTFQLKKICVEVIRGDLARTTAHLLEFMHRLHASQDAIVENIPTDERWQGYHQAGYFEVFHRIEMVCELDSPGDAHQN
jgi:ribosomal protein S18 acetylase RimI-like enzyme